MKSQFEKIVQEDFNQFRDIATRFQKVNMEDLLELYQLSKDALLLQTRWSEIQSNASKIAATYKDINKTDFATWAYQKYRILQELQITVRSWYRLSKDDERATYMNGDN